MNLLIFPLPLVVGGFFVRFMRKIYDPNEEKEKNKMRSTKKIVTMILAVMLVAAMALGMAGCGKKKDAAAFETTTYEDGTVLGEGSKTFTFTVVDKDGKETTLEVHTEKDTVGDALLEHKVIAGEDGDYGLYVKGVNGQVVDYDTDGKYWAFYINGEYGMTGVDVTTITEGDSYAFKVE